MQLNTTVHTNKVSLNDLMEIQKAFLILQFIVDECQLPQTLFIRKLDALMGRVVLDRVMSSFDQKIEVTL
jgi:hypothetical protein